jgi:hypothetical protein
MLCGKCQRPLDPEDVREHGGRSLCEDCYMDALSPARSCDPWAVYTASRLPEQIISPAQEAILGVIDLRGQATAAELMAEAGLSLKELEREIAALRHMEMVRAAPVAGGGKVFLRFKDTAH